MRKEDLVVLMYGNNTCHIGVVEVSEAEEKSRLEVDIEKEQWSYSRWKDNQIGSRRSMIDKASDHPINEGIIGVYDRTNTEHLAQLVSHATSAARNELL